MRHAVTAALFFAGLIHLLPLAGMLGPERLAALYGVSVAEPNLEILLRHRAVLFGMLGGFLLYAAFHREWQGAALLAGLVSAGAFVAMAVTVGGHNPQISKVVVADVLCVVVLAAGAAAWWFTRRLAPATAAAW